MAGKRNGLGKGLDSLIPNKTVKEESASQQKVSKEKQEKNVGSGEILVKINEVEPNREQPRKEFDEDSLMEKGKVYNVPKECWFYSITQKDTKMVYVQDSGCSMENSDFCDLSEEEIKKIQEEARHLFA